MIDLERCTPNSLERDCLEALPAMIAERDAETDKAKRKVLTARIRNMRTMASWCRSRAGYVE